MIIAITGATSMLGLATIKACISHGVKVLAFARKNSSRLYRIPKIDTVNIIELDLSEMSEFNCGNYHADVFIHFGWTHTVKAERNDVTKQIDNIGYTMDAIRLAKRLGCTKFIGAGSQAEYGRSNDVLSIKTPCNPIVPYGIAKYCSGKFAKVECEKLDIECVWVRILSVYGVNDSEATLISQLIKNVKNNIPMKLSGCEQIWDYLFEDDAGEAFVALAKFGKNGRTYNLGSGVGRKLKDYVLELIDLVNPDYNVRFGEIPYSLIQPVYLVADINDLYNDVRWKPLTSFKDGITKILRYI